MRKSPGDGFAGLCNPLLNMIVLSSGQDVFHEVYFDVFMDLLLAEQWTEGEPDAFTILV